MAGSTTLISLMLGHAGDGCDARSGRLIDDTELRAVVQAALELEWSPEQIAAWLREAYPGPSDWHVCHETIYQALYHGGTRGLSRQLTVKLRTGRPLRKRRRRADERSPRFVAPALLIDQRPDVVEERNRIGDWEGDLITGRLNGSAIGTAGRPGQPLRAAHPPARRTRADISESGSSRRWATSRPTCDGP